MLLLNPTQPNPSQNPLNPKTMKARKERRPDLYEIVVTTGQRFNVKEDILTLLKDISISHKNSLGLLKVTTDAVEGYDSWDPTLPNTPIPDRFLLEEFVFINPNLIVFIYPLT
jgi:hypothetical protein